MKLFVDTNVMLDLIAHREPFYADATRLFSMAERGEIDAVVAAISFSTCAYVLENKMAYADLSLALRQFSSIVSVAAIDEKVVSRAIAEDSRFTDIEDGMQYYAAVQTGCNFIVTRNQKDFKNSDIPVMSTKEFLDFFADSNRH